MCLNGCRNSGSIVNGKSDQAFFDCSTHTKRRGKCRSHFIRASVLERMVLKHMKLVMGYILCHEAHFRAVMEEQLLLESSEKIRSKQKQRDRDEKRIAELKRLFMKIYEDNAAGRLSDERYELLSQSYESEQKELEAEVVTLQKEIEVQKQQNESIEQFIQTANKYVDLNHLDAYALHELVQGIYVDAPDKSSGHTVQHIHIKYNGLGFIPLDKLLQKETA